MTKKTPKPAEKKIVLTLYGKGEDVTELSINLFTEGSAKRHCRNVNTLELKGGKWVHAAIVEESDKLIIKKPPTAGKDISLLLCLDDRSIQKTLRKLGVETLMYALKNAPTAVQDKVFKNMSTNAARCLKEDIEFVGKVRLSKVRAAQSEIAAIVDALVLKGEIEIIDENFV